MKFFFNILILVFLSVALYRIFGIGENETLISEKVPEVSIKTYNKEIATEDIELPSSKEKSSSDEVLEKSDESIKKRGLDNMSRSKGDGHALIQGRMVIGGDFMPLKSVYSQNYVFENEVNPDWKSLAVKEFMDDDEHDGQVDIFHLESQVYLRDGTALFIEKVRIKVAETDGIGGEFNAYLDSSTGEVLHAWDPSSDPFEDFKMSEDTIEDSFDDFSTESTDDTEYYEEFSSQ